MTISRILTTLQQNKDNLSYVVLINLPEYVIPLINSRVFESIDRTLIVIQDQSIPFEDKTFGLYAPDNPKRILHKLWTLGHLCRLYDHNNFQPVITESQNIDLLGVEKLKIDWIIYKDGDSFSDYKFLLNLLKNQGFGLIIKIPQDDPNWLSLPSDKYQKIINGENGIIQPLSTTTNNIISTTKTVATNVVDKEIRVAILIVGLTRKYKQASKSLFDNLINQAPKNVKFDFFLNTWDIEGDYQYENKNFNQHINLNWIKDSNSLQCNTLKELKTIYNPKILEIDNFKIWKQENLNTFNTFIQKHKLEDEQIRIFNGIFAQYYQVWRGFQAMENWTKTHDVATKTHDVATKTHDVATKTHDVATKTHDVATKTKPYDLVIRTRYDIQIIEVSNIDWQKLVNIGKHKIIGLEQWDRNGIRGNWIAGGWDLMKQFSELWTCLDKLTYENDIKKIKLASIHVPKYIFNYFFADPKFDPETMDKKEIFERAYPYLEPYVSDFIKDVNHVSFHVSLIPEIFLQFYLEKIRKIPVHLEGFLKVKVYPDSDSNELDEVVFNRMIT